MGGLSVLYYWTWLRVISQHKQLNESELTFYKKKQKKQAKISCCCLHLIWPLSARYCISVFVIPR